MTSRAKPKSHSDLAMQHAKRFLRSAWFFPAVLFIVVCLFTALKISGTSIGSYHQILYGTASKDPALLLGKPEPIRSDEWLVVSQLTIAQAKANYPRINHNLGNGEDMSVVPVAPYKEWSEAFRPQDLAFFIMPLEHAFAFKWWLMGYLLIVSCYLFILTVLPGRKLLAAGLSMALFFSAFVQWWYVYSTLGSLYYSFFIATSVILLLRQKERWKKIALSALLTYLLVCFALVLYPPFQIACGLVLLAFLVGYVLQNYSSLGKRQVIRSLLYAAGSGLAAIAIAGIFVSTHSGVIKTIEHTAYPGTRSIPSGGIFADHFLASHLGHQFLSIDANSQYLIDNKSPSNQSEASNFLLLIPFLFLPSLLLVYQEYKRKQPLDWPLLLLNLLFVVFLLELFVPAFTPISRLLLLTKVGAPRLLIGVGLLNIMVLVLFIKNLAKKKAAFGNRPATLYSLAVLAVELVVSLHAHYAFGTFIGLRRALLFSLPIPLIIYLLLKKRFVFAAGLYLVFSLFIAVGVNPLYKDLGTLTNNPLDAAVQTIGSRSDKRWVTDGGYLENLALINGEPSLTGVYNYPQLSLWNTIPGVRESNYNRYAHVGFQISDDPSARTTLSLGGQDSFSVKTNSCSPYLRQADVGFYVSATVLNGRCTKLLKTVPFPAVTLYIYAID